MNENEIKPPEQPQPDSSGQPQAEQPIVESETILVSTRTPLLLENPLAQIDLLDTATFSTLHEKIGSFEEGTFTVSLDEVEAHPFTQAMPLTEALPPTVLSQENPVAQPKLPASKAPEDLVVSRPAPAEVVFAEHPMPEPESAQPSEDIPLGNPGSVELDAVQSVPFEVTNVSARKKHAEPESAQPSEDIPLGNPGSVELDAVQSVPFEVTNVSARKKHAEPESAQPSADIPLGNPGSVELDAVQSVPFEVTNVSARKKQPKPIIAPVATPIKEEPVKPTPVKRETAVAKPSVKQAAPPPKTPDTPPPTPQKRKRWWLWILGIVLVLFLGTIGGVVPVENIPVLRNIAHAMGFTPEQAKQMSFLRALLTWTDKTLGLNGRLSAAPQVGESRLFSSQQGAGPNGENAEDEGGTVLAGKMARYTGKSSLIDMRALNELQRSKGRRPDQLAGTVLLLPGQKAETRASMRDTDVTVRTEANRDKGEVYFGSDASAINREFEDGYDSIKTLKKIANPHIADGQPIDFMMQMTTRMMKVNTGLAGIDKELGTSVVGWKTGPGEVGDNKPLKDLYHAWITSRMSNYTTSIMLKKTLADASFLGAAIPSQASDSLTFGGVRIDSDSLEEDQEGWKEYLEFEQRCKAELTEDGHGGPIVQSAVDSFNDLFPETARKGVTAPENANFPTNCTDVLKTPYQTSTFYRDTVAKIHQACHNMVEGYKKLEDSCKMAVDYKTNRCDSNDIVGDVRAHYQARYEKFQQYCRDKYCEEQKKAYEEAHKDDNPPAPAFECDPSGLSNWSNSGNYKESCANPPCSSDVYFASQSTANLIKAEVGGTQDYFPQITKDQEYEDNEHRVQTTIVAGIEKNGTL